MVLNNNLNKNQIKFSAFAILSIIFLWSKQLFIGEIGIPYYIIVSLFFLYYTKFTIFSIAHFFLLSCLLLLIFFMQSQQNAIIHSSIKSIISIIVLAYMIVCCRTWSQIIIKEGHDLFFKVSKAFIYLQLFLMIFQLVSIKLGSKVYFSEYDHYIFHIKRVSGFFPEPSVVAIAFAPFLYMIVFHYGEMKYLIGKKVMITIFIIIALCPSTTLVGVIGLLSILYVYKNFGIRNILRILIVCLILLVSLISIIGFFPDIFDRVSTIYHLLKGNIILGASLNSSALLFIKGGQMAFNGLVNYPLGVGIMNFEALVSYSDVSDLSNIYFEKNIKDGTSILFKMIGEFGILGLIIGFTTILLVFKKVRNSNDNLFDNFFLFGFLASFIRSNSYFDGVQLLGLTFMVYYIGDKIFFFLKTAFFYNKDSSSKCISNPV